MRLLQPRNDGTCKMMFQTQRLGDFLGVPQRLAYWECTPFRWRKCNSAIKNKLVLMCVYYLFFESLSPKLMFLLLIFWIFFTFASPPYMKKKPPGIRTKDIPNGKRKIIIDSNIPWVEICLVPRWLTTHPPTIPFTTYHQEGSDPLQVTRPSAGSQNSIERDKTSPQKNTLPGESFYHQNRGRSWVAGFPGIWTPTWFGMASAAPTKKSRAKQLMVAVAVSSDWGSLKNGPRNLTNG